MDYPPGFPDRFKPRLEAEILRLRYKFPLAGDAPKRIDETLSVYVEMACAAVESGEWGIGLALDGLKEFARELCEDQADNTQQEWWTPKNREEYIIPLIWQITWSIQWYRYLDRFAKLVENKSIAPLEASIKAAQQESVEKPIRGERDPTVAARRTELRNMLRSGKRPTALSVCKRWDSQGIRVPESWTGEGIETWQQAFQKQTHRSRTKKLISKDSKAVQSLG